MLNCYRTASPPATLFSIVFRGVPRAGRAIDYHRSMWQAAKRVTGRLKGDNGARSKVQLESACRPAPLLPPRERRHFPVPLNYPRSRMRRMHRPESFQLPVEVILLSCPGKIYIYTFCLHFPRNLFNTRAATRSHFTCRSFFRGKINTTLASVLFDYWTESCVSTWKVSIWNCSNSKFQISSDFRSSDVLMIQHVHASKFRNLETREIHKDLSNMKEIST